MFHTKENLKKDTVNKLSKIINFIYMPDLTIIKDVLTDNALPVGVLDSGDIFGLSQEDRMGNMYVLGKSGQGKTVFLESLIISDLVNSRGGLLIDPFGDIVDEVVQYADKNNVIVFEVAKGDTEFNINKFKQEVDLGEIKNNKFVLCKLSYPVIGSHVAREVGTYILGEFYRLKNELNNISLYIDEFHNFVSKEINIVSNKENRIKCCVTDQSINQYSNDGLQEFFKVVDHIICYNVDSRTAKYVSESFGFNMDDLKNVEQYNFYTKLSINGNTTGCFKGKGLFPIPYSKKT